MPIEIKNIDNGIGNIIVGRGAISEDEIVTALRYHLTQDEAQFKKYKYSLSNYLAATEISVSQEAIIEIADYCIASSYVNPDAVIAIVAPQDIFYGMARMWEYFFYLHAKNSWESKVCRELDKAKDWISKRVNDKFGILDLSFC